MFRSSADLLQGLRPLVQGLLQAPVVPQDLLQALLQPSQALLIGTAPQLGLAQMHCPLLLCCLQLLHLLLLALHVLGTLCQLLLCHSQLVYEQGLLPSRGL